MDQYSIKPNISRALLPQVIELVMGIILLYLLVIYLIKMKQDVTLAVHLLVPGILIAAALLQLFLSYLSSAKTCYNMMADRIDILGNKPQTIMLADVQQVNLKTGPFDRLFGTGTIMLDGSKMRHIDSPQQVFQYAQQLVNNARYYRKS